MLSVVRVTKGLGFLCVAALALPLLACSRRTPPVQLVTPEEAALEESSMRGAEDLVDGPDIQLLSPENDGEYSQNFPVEILFSSKPNGFDIDMDSLKIVYRKLWGIDITKRVRQYIGDHRIWIPEVSLPRGVHRFEVYIEDVEDHASSRRFTVKVTP